MWMRPAEGSSGDAGCVFSGAAIPARRYRAAMVLEFGIQQSRGFKALKLWIGLRQVGLSGYRRLISHDIMLARALQQRLRDAEGFELVSAGPLSVTCFRYRP